MSQGVVDVLEIIQVEAGQRHGAEIPAAQVHDRFGLRIKRAAVGEAGQVIGAAVGTLFLIIALQPGDQQGNNHERRALGEKVDDPDVGLRIVSPGKKLGNRPGHGGDSGCRQRAGSSKKPGRQQQR